MVTRTDDDEQSICPDYRLIDRAGVSPIYGRYFPEEKQVAFIPSCLYKALTDGGYSVEKCYAGFKERG